ncbi:VanW family protein [Bacillus sp. B-jedd]|uniref:VanW family protein n=1 Tax=Bacillus sp. B-jedd TaxID=1476857 RepID=UPI00051555E6|nr:VanW family protein [Bacillus sp. B-jedd]CEG28035.1 VanW like protein [Bacillus sp. B-jedd]
MKKYQQFLKVFLVLILSTAYVYGFSQYGARALGPMFAGDETYSSGTTVGSVNLEGKSAQEALELLKAAAADWYANSTLKLHYKEKTITLETEQFVFDPEETISSLADGRKNAMGVSLDESVLVDWIGSISLQLIGEEINLKDLSAKLAEPAAILKTGDFTVGLEKFMPKNEADEGVISEGTVDVEEPSSDLDLAVREFASVTIEGGTEFSFNRLVKEKGLENVSNEALSMMATATYIAVLQTNFEILERNISKELPDYAKLGSEVFISSATGKDFVFANPNKDKYELSFTYSGGKLAASISGTKFLYEYKMVADGKALFKPKTIKQFSPLLKNRQVNIVEEGKEGAIIKIYREIYSQGNLLDTIVMSEDYYPPVHRVEVHALPASQPNEGQVQTDGQNPFGSQDGNTGEAPETPIAPTNPDPGGSNPLGPSEDQTVSQPGETPGGDNYDDGGLWGKPNEIPK